MDDITKKKFIAGAKIAGGALRVGSAVLTATGHGIVGTFLKNHHMMHSAVRLGKLGLDGGLKMLDDGIEEWKRAR